MRYFNHRSRSHLHLGRSLVKIKPLQLEGFSFQLHCNTLQRIRIDKTEAAESIKHKKTPVCCPIW